MSGLRERLCKGDTLIAPGVFDMISAKIAQEVGFEALYMTGYGVVASKAGLPDAGLATYTDMIERVGTIAGGVSTPVICDGDTGYGGLLNVQHTVRGYERAGAAAIQIEDQEFPKKCGHTPGRRVIAAEDMAAKIRVATETRDNRDFLIIARTDARTAYGLDEALRRADIYAKAGADLLFIESPESIEEMQTIASRFDLPLVANMVEGGSTPILSARELGELGFSLAIFPALGFLSAAATLRRAYRTLAETGDSRRFEGELYDFLDFSRLMGFEKVWEFERQQNERQAEAAPAK
jgi:2-methylisocitrate lyase-like PEP mutase family enzyme